MAPFTQQAVAPRVDSLALSSFLGLPSLAYVRARSPAFPSRDSYLSGLVHLSNTFAPHPETSLTHHPSPPALPESGSFVYLSYLPLVSRSPPSFRGISTSAHTSGTLKHRVISLYFFMQ